MFSADLLHLMTTNQCYDLTSTERLVLLILTTYLDAGGSGMPTQQTIATAAGLGLRTVNRAIGQLEQKGYIDKSDQFINRQRIASRYQLDLAS